MALGCVFYDLIIPISNIDRVYEGGFEKFKADNISKFGKGYWHDEYLFHDGAVDPEDINSIAEKWESLGLKGIEVVNYKPKFKDFCIVESLHGGPTLSCDWLEFDPENKTVWLKGKPKGEIVEPVW
jgi:hypothetical protein